MTVHLCMKNLAAFHISFLEKKKIFFHFLLFIENMDVNITTQLGKCIMLFIKFW